jgi:ferredoxin-fold anticodon binding domain-containing protein
MNVQQINSAIITGKLTNDELTSVIDAVKFARARLAQTLKFSLRVGQKVQFTSSRSGMTLVGTVRKVAIKNVIVDTPQGGYKVPANMLEAV